MMLRDWKDLPAVMQCDEVKAYYHVLKKKTATLVVKRVFDVAMAAVLLLLLAIPMLIIAVMIKIDSRGPVFYRQERVTTYGDKFKIHKFRTMVNNADRIGPRVTVYGDSRITKVGAKLRSLRIDEIPQLIDVLLGDMTFVGTRPEVVKYVEQYNKEYLATLLLPAGITSEASLEFKDEDTMLKGVDDVDAVYVNQILPLKMKWNLAAIKKTSILYDIRIMIKTAVHIVK